MLPILSLMPDQMTKTPSASPISPPHNSELFSFPGALMSLLMLHTFRHCTQSGSPTPGRSAAKPAKGDGPYCMLRGSAADAASHLGMTVFLRQNSIGLLRQAERVDHLAFGIGDLDDELLVVFGALVVRNHVV